MNEIDKNISSIIYIELMKICKGYEFKSMKEFIYSRFLEKFKKDDNIIDFIDNLNNNDKKIFLEKLMEKFEFKKEDFYSNNENTKILLLCELYENSHFKIIDKSNYYYEEIEKELARIRKDLEGEIKIEKLDEFLKNKKDVVIKRLGLIKLIFEDYNPEEKYNNLKIIVEEIKKDIKDLTFIRDSLLIFHKNKFQKEIKIIEKIKDIKENNLNNYKSKEIK